MLARAGKFPDDFPIAQSGPSDAGWKSGGHSLADEAATRERREELRQAEEQDRRQAKSPDSILRQIEGSAQANAAASFERVPDPFRNLQVARVHPILLDIIQSFLAQALVSVVPPALALALAQASSS